MSHNPSQRNYNRARAAELFESGARQCDVARELGVSRVTVMHWHRLWQGGGRPALLKPGRRGRRPQLDSQQEERVRSALDDPPEHWGVAAEHWSLATVAELIERITGVRYHRRHITRLLKRLGWIIPPVGRHAAEAMCSRRLADTDGNVLILLRKGLPVIPRQRPRP